MRAETVASIDALKHAAVTVEVLALDDDGLVDELEAVLDAELRQASRQIAFDT